jgi:HlyD family secretion protein
VQANPLMTIGSVEPLHIRGDIDEADSWRVDSKSPAIACLRGNPAVSVALNFVRFEPYVLPKRSLSGDNTERVDTRVLQVLYAFAPKDFPAFVGQQVDVFIKASPRAEVMRHPASGHIVYGASKDKNRNRQSSAIAANRRVDK